MSRIKRKFFRNVSPLLYWSCFKNLIFTSIFNPSNSPYQGRNSISEILIMDRGVRGVSVVGVVIASTIGLITIFALSKMMVNINTGIETLKKQTNQRALVNQINNLFLNDEGCKGILKNSIDPLENLYHGGQGVSNSDPIEFLVLKDRHNNPVLDLDTDTADTTANKEKAEKLKNLYNLEGHSFFQLSCKQQSSRCDCTVSPIPSICDSYCGMVNDCDCSLPVNHVAIMCYEWCQEYSQSCNCSANWLSYPCSKDWLLSLFTMNYKNNLPVYKKVLQQGLKISWTASGEENFECQFGDTPNPSQTTLTCNEANRSWCGSPGQKRDIPTPKSVCAPGEWAEYICGELSDFNSLVAMGYESGQNVFNPTSTNNSFLGYQTGYSNVGAKDNSFMGSQAGLVNTTGEKNSFLGFQAGGNNTTGDNNNFFGYKAGFANTTESNLLNIGNVIYGKTGPSDKNYYPSLAGVHIDKNITLQVCDPVCKNVRWGTSSREYKKNIVPFQEYEEALEALLATPLFNYQYKDDYPEKTRVGVIAEELPESLQLPAEPDSPAQPDWPSIYGYLWAGIKALHKELMVIKDIVLQLKELDKFDFKDSDVPAYTKPASLTAWLKKSLLFMHEKTTKEVQNLKAKKQKLTEQIKKQKKANQLFKAKLLLYQQVEEKFRQEIAQIKKQEQQFQEELQKMELKK